MSVRVEGGTTWPAGSPTKLFDAQPYGPLPGNVGRPYDVSPDGKRFLMIRQADGPDQPSNLQSLVVVQNWMEELKRLVPTTR